jgi:hypothetical protein
VLDVGRIGHQQDHPRLAELGNAAQVGQAVVEGRLVELEVAGVDHHAGGRVDREANRVGDRVGHRKRLDREGAEGRGAARVALQIGRQVMLPQAVPHESQRER